MIYLAYGSNLHIEQMQRRCPTAEVLGTSTLHGYRLVFNGVATIEPDPDRSVPVLLWDIKPADEIPLDRYEGYPRLYRRDTVQIELDGKAVDAMVYIMNEKHYCHAPGASYYQVLIDGYRDFHFPLHVLRQALVDSVGGAEARLFLERGGFDGGR